MPIPVCALGYPFSHRGAALDCVSPLIVARFSLSTPLEAPECNQGSQPGLGLISIFVLLKVNQKEMLQIQGTGKTTASQQGFPVCLKMLGCL